MEKAGLVREGLLVIKRMPTKNGPGDRPRREIPWSQVRFALDSPLERDGFEPSVPHRGELW